MRKNCATYSCFLQEDKAKEEKARPTRACAAKEKEKGEKDKVRNCKSTVVDRTQYRCQCVWIPLVLTKLTMVSDFRFLIL